MTPQEAIEIVTNAIQTETMTAEQDKALAIVQKATDKQIPKKVIFMSDKSKVCGRCKQRVLRHQPYCDDCGQALDWGNSE